MSLDDYNYSTFRMDGPEMAAFDTFESHLRVGAPAPSGALTDAATGEDVELASLWKRDHLLIEFGSFT